MIGARYLSSEDLEGLASQEEFVEAVRSAYRERGMGAPTKPRRTIEIDEPPGKLNSYTAILPDTGVMGGYMYSAGFEDADARFVTPLFDSTSGKPLAVVDGAYMNTYKTGAVGAVGIDALARETIDTVAVIGSGAQARGQLRGVLAVREFDEGRIYSPTRRHREEFAREWNDRADPEIFAVESTEAALDGADVVITATNADRPVVGTELVEDGMHINAIGQYHPRKHEIEPETVQMSLYVPDLRERAQIDAGAFLQARERGLVRDDHIHAELGEVVAGVEPGRTADDEVTIFDSGGTALETVASAALLYRRAKERGLGRTIEFASASQMYEGKRSSTTDEF